MTSSTCFSDCLTENQRELVWVVVPDCYSLETIARAGASSVDAAIKDGLVDETSDSQDGEAVDEAPDSEDEEPVDETRDSEDEEH